MVISHRNNLPAKTPPQARLACWDYFTIFSLRSLSQFSLNQLLKRILTRNYQNRRIFRGNLYNIEAVGKNYHFLTKFPDWVGS